MSMQTFMDGREERELGGHHIWCPYRHHRVVCHRVRSAKCVTPRVLRKMRGTKCVTPHVLHRIRAQNACHRVHGAKRVTPNA
ncbi:MAG: hypothetical protein RSE38_14665 [Acinetobacter sp.]